MKRFKNWETKQGKYFVAQDEKALVIGSSICKKFKLKVGDELTVRGEMVSFIAIIGG